MNIEFDVYKQKLNDCKPALEGLADSLNLTGLKNEMERLQAMQEAPGFWDDPDKSQKIVVKARKNTHIAARLVAIPTTHMKFFWRISKTMYITPVMRVNICKKST